jgi:hypothetical protein
LIFWIKAFRLDNVPGMWAMTIDQRRSRSTDDAVPALLRRLSAHEMVRAFERTAGDEVQGLSDQVETVIDIVVDVAGTRAWWVGVGAGPVEEPLPRSVRASRGPALILARQAVERAHKTPAGVALEGHEAVHAETALLILAGIVSERTAEGHEAVGLVRQGLTQKDAATRLGITSQAMSQRLRAARWTDETRVRRLASYLMSAMTVPEVGRGG